MPESSTRKQFDYTPPPAKKIRREQRVQAWIAPLMVIFFLLGLAWVVVYYVSEARLPISGIGNWNLLIGLGMIACGFMAATRWK